MEGKELRLLRNRLSLTQAQLAQCVGVTPNTLGRWEREEYAIPVDVVPKLFEIAMKEP